MPSPVFFIQKKKKRFGFFFFHYSCGFGAPTGHTPAQAPHSIQRFGSISYFPSPSLIASTGHSAWQAPQLMQSSLIQYAIGNTPPQKNRPFYGLMSLFYHIFMIFQGFSENKMKKGYSSREESSFNSFLSTLMTESFNIRTSFL